MTAISLLFTLAAIGISETVYLIRTRVAAEKPFCPIGGGCVVVLTSPYSKIFIIPNDVLGLIMYLGVSVMAALLVIGVAPIPLWSGLLKLGISVATLASLFFSYLQWRVIKAWCFWCVMSALTIWLMGLIILSSQAV